MNDDQTAEAIREEISLLKSKLNRLKVLLRQKKVNRKKVILSQLKAGIPVQKIASEQKISVAGVRSYATRYKLKPKYIRPEMRKAIQVVTKYSDVLSVTDMAKIAGTTTTTIKKAMEKVKEHNHTYDIS